MGDNRFAGELPSATRVAARLSASQMLFTAGHSLTTGGIYNYFFNSLKPSATWLGVLQAAPELFETAAVFTRPLVMGVMSRKALWIAGLVLGRLAALGIPLLAVLLRGQSAADILPWMLVVIGLWYALQGLSYVSLLSWLSDLAPERAWGRVFATRQLVHILMTMLMGTVAGQALRWQKAHLPPDQQQWFYVIAFTVGGVVAAFSFLPMLGLPALPTHPNFERRAFLRPLVAALRDRQFRWLLIWATHMAFFQGLTQAVITKYQIDILKIPLDRYLFMLAVMQIIQAVLSVAAGVLSDRIGDRNLLFLSHLLLSVAMVFPFLATPEHPQWQLGAYIVWGLFGIVNVVMYTLAWRLAPRSDNTSYLAVLRPLSGLTAALAGILGGILLDRLLQAQWSTDLLGRSWSGFHLLFFISFVGRFTAPFWLLRISQPEDGKKSP